MYGDELEPCSNLLRFIKLRSSEFLKSVSRKHELQ
jgi:hypothetical protein